ncbi:MAG: DUF3159 domain-containing protein [Acidimicrobiales bacterium]|nr:DUF3159 domain-containing protein [Acidimicrobiales bacterium]HRW37961.1 VC0807 family protein [Aquihabitans sp.]
MTPRSDLDGPPALPELSRRSIVASVARRGGPRLVEASFLPTALFWVALATTSIGVAYAVAIAWTYGCVLRRVLRRQEVTGVLLLASLGLTVRTAIAVGSGSTFVYFAQPVIGTTLAGLVFFGSLLTGRPLIGRIAHDFWEITPEQADLPSVRRLMRRLTVLWGSVNLATAATTFVLLKTLPLAHFVAAKQVSGWAITAVAIGLTITWAHATASAEGVIAPRCRRRERRAAATVPGELALPLAA